MKLLPKDRLIKTSAYDQADWNYRFLLGYISRSRYRLVSSFLSDRRFDRILELGYGSGIFLPKLSEYCNELYGVDIHSKNKEITSVLAALNIRASLYSESATDIRFENNFFDCIIAVSTIEFIEDIDSVCKEIKRVLQPYGVFIVVTPGHSPIVDFGLRLLTGKNARKDFQNRRQLVIPTLLGNFVLHEKKTIPPFIERGLNMYTALVLRADS